MKSSGWSGTANDVNDPESIDMRSGYRRFVGFMLHWTRSQLRGFIYLTTTNKNVQCKVVRLYGERWRWHCLSNADLERRVSPQRPITGSSYLKWFLPKCFALLACLLNPDRESRYTTSLSRRCFVPSCTVCNPCCIQIVFPCDAVVIRRSAQHAVVFSYTRSGKFSPRR